VRMGKRIFFKRKKKVELGVVALNLIESGKSSDQVAEEMGINISLVLFFENTCDDIRRDAKILEEIKAAKELKCRRVNYNLDIEANRDLIIEDLKNRNCLSLEDFCKSTLFKPVDFFKYCKNEGISLPENLEPWGYRSEIDDLVEIGFNQLQISNKLGISGQAISKYLNGSLMIKKYRQVQEKMGLRFYDDGFSSKFSQEQNEAIKIGIGLNLSQECLAHYVGCSAAYVKIIKKKENISKGEFTPIKFYDGDGRLKRLPDRVASQIYEFKDAGYSDDDILKLVGGCSQDKIDYAKKQRERVEGHLIDCLEKMFPGRKFDKGYLS
jgi:predicted transcriptional regulator